MDEINRSDLTDAIEGVMRVLADKGYSARALHAYRSGYDKLTGIAEELAGGKLDDHVVDEFVTNGGPDNVGKRAWAGRQARERCVKYLISFIEGGRIDFARRRDPRERPLARQLSERLAELDERQAARGLARSTRAKYHLHSRYFLEYLGRESLAGVRAGDVSRAIGAIAQKHCTPTTLCSALPGIRAFCSMFEELAPFVGEVPERLPKSSPMLDVFDREERARISAHARSGALSKRDEAICLLSLEAGLRGADICNLKVGDVDWSHDSIHIVQTKTGRGLDLPLRASYGNAIAGYLIDERPESAEDWLFLAVKAPHGKLSSVGDVISGAVSGAGVELRGRSAGTRTLRHSAASAMLREGAPLPAIAGMLGHASPDTTMIYITTQADVMSTLVLPLPGEAADVRP